MESPENPPLKQTLVLVEQAQQGSRTAVEDLFARYMPRVKQIVALRMGQRLLQFTGLDDVTQDVLLKIFKDLDRFQPTSESSFRYWLANCIECEVKDLARKARAKKRGGDRAREPLLSGLFIDQETPSQVVAAKETEDRIEEALLSLPDHYRQVLILRNLCEMTYAEIAQVMHFGDEATARKAVSRARGKLKEALGEG